MSSSVVVSPAQKIPAGYPTTTATLDVARHNHPQKTHAELVAAKQSPFNPNPNPIVACAPLAEQISYECGLPKQAGTLLARLITQLQERCNKIEEEVAGGPHPLRQTILELLQRVEALEKKRG